jgi:hypothetical protein
MLEFIAQISETKPYTQMIIARSLLRLIAIALLVPSPAIARFSKADLWHCEQISRQRGDRVYHNHLLNIAHQFGPGLFFSPRT